ncbi:MAG TPA: cytochrome C nitrite reductase [Alphaproteobacteria bacterium]|jgi:DNA-binding beta-propeller fold protein YncE|nr:cytochrome C nitrite reductase [Alphaproteobacteria bacterium]
MKITGWTILATMTLAMVTSAGAGELKQVGAIKMPGATLESFDIGWVDQQSGHYFLADRSNKSVDVIDAKTDKYLTRVTGFVGDGPKGNVSGPNGVVAVNNATEVWAGDGDSTVKVVDLKAGKVVDTISTGGTKRADEVAWDPREGVFIVANDADEPPFVTLISTKPGHKVLGKITFPQATDGIEQSAYNPADGMFYVDIPQIDKQKTKGGLAVIDPKTAKLVKIIPLESCIPHGLVKGAGSQLFVGCNAGTAKDGLPPQMVVFDAAKGAVVATIPGAGGSDEAAANPKAGHWYAATSNDKSGPALAVIDMKANSVIQKYKTAVGAHSVAVYEANSHVYVPTRASNGGCGGCILVLAPK